MQTENAPYDLLKIEDFYDRASTRRRLANFLIDLVVFYIFVFLLAILLTLIAPTFLNQLTDDNSGFSLVDRIFSLIFYALYMSVVEAVFKGKSIGKFITKTRAVNTDGSPIDANKAFARGFSRAVPFCVFSALGKPCDPWQDKWTRTKVINEIL